MLDAVTLEFPYSPPGGYTKEYLRSRDFILEEMASRLNRLSHGRGPVGLFIHGELFTGKTVMLEQLRDVASRRHGGAPTVSLQVRNGKSVFKMLAEGLLAQLERPEYAKRDLKRLKSIIKSVRRLARWDADMFDIPRPTMKARLLSLCELWKEADLRVVVFIDDVHETEANELVYLVNFISTTQSQVVPMLFVVSGEKSIIPTIRSVRSDANKLFSIHQVSRAREG